MQRGKIGRRLRNLRRWRGVSQDWVAKKVHAERKTISRYENGGGISADLADEVLQALGCIYVLGVDLSPEQAREVMNLIKRFEENKRKGGLK